MFTYNESGKLKRGMRMLKRKLVHQRLKARYCPHLLDIVWLHIFKVPAPLSGRHKRRGREQHLNVRDVVSNTTGLISQARDVEGDCLVLGPAWHCELKRRGGWRPFGQSVRGVLVGDNIALGLVNKIDQLDMEAG